VTLPLRLYLSGPSPAFDLGDSFMRQWLYQIVLREAASPEDLTTYLHAGTLVSRQTSPPHRPLAPEQPIVVICLVDRAPHAARRLCLALGHGFGGWAPI
jgi:hypothetical protein